MIRSLRPSAAKHRIAASLWALGWLIVISALPALAQHSGPPGSSAPPLPSGAGRLTVQVIGEIAGGESGGLAIALYALSPDGTPGFANGETDIRGAHTFEGISTDPQIVYLVGVRYDEIPFGERVTFAPGEAEARVEIEISEPTDQLTGVEVEELRVRVDWMGDRLVVREILRINQSGERVIRLPAKDPDHAIAVRPLEPEARDFAAGASSIGEGLGLVAGGVRFWGPLYPGEQGVEYQYTWPVDGLEARLPIVLREAAKRVVVVAGTPGIEVSGPGLIASSEVSSDAGTPLSAWARSGLRGGERFDVTLTLPEIRRDPELVTIPRADHWLEVDDTQLTATVNFELEVPPGPPVSGTPDQPLFHVAIPTGATLVGVAPEAESLGLVPMEGGGFDVTGPIAPGKTTLAFSYKLPAAPDGIDLDLRFPREVATLNVLIADTGLALDSSRLHRLRPFRSGTRNYLHREAFNVSPDEVVDLELVPLRGAGLPRQAAIALTVGAAAAGALFLFMPLRAATRREDEVDSESDPLRSEREAIYTAIGDLDHDFETGKLEPEDYRPMREGLRERAIALLREEREAARDTPAAQTSGASESATAEIGAFCPACGERVRSVWRFCSHCGGKLEPTDTAEAQG